MLLSKFYKVKIWKPKYYELSYFGFNFHRKSTIYFIFSLPENQKLVRHSIHQKIFLLTSKPLQFLALYILSIPSFRKRLPILPKNNTISLIKLTNNSIAIFYMSNAEKRWNSFRTEWDIFFRTINNGFNLKDEQRKCFFKKAIYARNNTSHEFQEWNFTDCRTLQI